MTIHCTTFVPTVQTTRARNGAEQRRVHAIVNVMERLEAFAALAITKPGDAGDLQTRRDHAARIVDAVIAEMRSSGVYE